MIEKKKKRRRLSVEILLIVGLCFVLSLILYLLITVFGSLLLQEYFFNHDIYPDEFQWYRVDNTLRSVGFAVSVLFFTALFFALFGERLAYVRKITAGVDALRQGDYGVKVVLVGNNELTELAEEVNYLSEQERMIDEREKKINEDKEALIRALSHDIRTPLTSIMSYTELLSEKETVSDGEQQAYLQLVSKKTEQIKKLTDILLDGGKRSPEFFEDARLLFRQLGDEFEIELEDVFTLDVGITFSEAFSGTFDVGELRRIFDNLISNIKKYADSKKIVSLSVLKNSNGIVLTQSNSKNGGRSGSESYGMGLGSIKRIALNYGGAVAVSESEDKFEITVTLSDF